VDLAELENAGEFNGPLFSALGRKIFQNGLLNDFMALTRPYWKEARTTIQTLFSIDSKLKEDK
jgi:fumarylacetoacetase